MGFGGLGICFDLGSACGGKCLRGEVGRRGYGQVVAVREVAHLRAEYP